MGKVVRDDSIGQALGLLGTGLAGNPQKEWQAYALKQRTDVMAQNMVEKQRQLDAQDGLVAQFDQMLTPERMGVRATVPGPVTPGPLPAEGTYGPNPGIQGPDVPNPMAAHMQAKLGFGRAAARNMVMQGASIGDTYAALAQAGILAGGIPTDESAARQASVALTGKMPDARVPITERQRVLMREEEAQAALKGAVSVPKEGRVFMSPEQGRSLGIVPNDQGQYIAGGAGEAAADATPNPDFGGTGEKQQHYNNVLEYQRALAAGEGPILPDLERRAALSWGQVFDPHTEIRTGEGGRLDRIRIEPDAIPPGFQRPGGRGGMPGGGGAPAAQPMQPQGQPMQPQGQPAPGQPQALPLPTLPQSPTGMPAQQGAPGGVSVENLRAPVPKTLTEAQDKTVGFLGRIQQGDAALTEIEDAGGIPGGFQRSMSDPRSEPIMGAPDYIDRPLRETITTDNAKRHRTSMEQFISGVLRKESGAVIGPTEYKAAEEMFIPRSGDPPDLVQSKRAARKIASSMMEAGLLGGEPAQIVATIRAEVAKQMGAARGAGGGAGGGQSYDDVDAIVGLRRK
jgi:hypothetical protein